MELHIIGDGPQSSPLELLIGRLAIRSGVHFHGWLPHTSIQEVLRTCDVLALPSIREFGGAVVIEAMSLGLMPIVANYGGPSELVGEHTGIRIPFHDRQSLVENMRQAIGKVIRSPSLIDRLGANGRQEVIEKLTWDAKAAQIHSVYQAVLGGSGDLRSLNFHNSQQNRQLFD
jgi:glycosyltransferase involved in cell wall biosynthesis